MTLANSSASAFVLMKAPLPYLTSNNMQLQPAANFFDMIDEAIRGIESTVPVTSLSA